MVAKSYNNNIFKVITELDKQNYNFFKNYNDVQYKDLKPRIMAEELIPSDLYDENIREVVRITQDAEDYVIDHSGSLIFNAVFQMIYWFVILSYLTQTNGFEEIKEKCITFTH